MAFRALTARKSEQETATSVASRVVVSEVLRGRYRPGSRPVSWDERSEGVELVRTDEGREIALFSTGGQSTPAAGWELMLGDPVGMAADAPVYSWTLYGIKPGAHEHQA